MLPRKRRTKQCTATPARLHQPLTRADACQALADPSCGRGRPSAGSDDANSDSPVPPYLFSGVTTWITDLIDLFHRQDALASTAQLRQIQVPRGVVRRRLATGEWIRPAAGVIGLPGPITWERRVRIALLASGPSALASHGTAARLHRFDGYDRHDGVAVCSIGGAHIHAPDGTRVSRTRSITSRHRLELPNGLAVVCIPVALVQVASDDGVDAAARALDGVLRSGANPRWIKSVVEGLARPGLSGPATLLRLLRERVDRRLPRSWFQRLAKRALSTSGLELVDEWPVHDGARLLAELDLAIPALKVGVECQSWSWHATPAAKDRDNRRRRRLRELGWEIVEVWWTDLDRIDEVARDLVVVVGRRRPSMFDPG